MRSQLLKTVLTTLMTSCVSGRVERAAVPYGTPDCVSNATQMVWRVDTLLAARCREASVRLGPMF